MSRNERIDRTIVSIIGGLENLSIKLPAARAHLLDQINQCGSIRAADYTASHITHTGDTTPVEAAMLQTDRLKAQLDDLNDNLNAVALIVHNLNRDCDRTIGTRQPGRQTPRCDGGVNYRGYIIPLAEGGWSNPACQNTPTEGKTCDSCEMEAGKWARRNPKNRHTHELTS